MKLLAEDQIGGVNASQDAENVSEEILDDGINTTLKNKDRRISVSVPAKSKRRGK